MHQLILRLLLSVAFISPAFAQPIYTPPTPAPPAPVSLTYQATFLASGSGTIPSYAVECDILAIGGGSSGAGGGTVASSGSGGGGGGTGVKLDTGWWPTNVLSTSAYTVVVGAGGSTASAGASGNAGGSTTMTFGSTVFTALGANNGQATAGASGVASTGAGGGAPNFNVGGNTVAYFYNSAVMGGSNSSATGTPTSVLFGRLIPSSGGAGGGLNTGTASAGGSGNLVSSFVNPDATQGAGGTIAGGNGGNGTSPSGWPLSSDAAGGGGGGGNGSGAGGNGGTGGQPGAGGGGGGSGTTGGGTGGAGGAGAIWIGCN